MIIDALVFLLFWFTKLIDLIIPSWNLPLEIYEVFEIAMAKLFLLSGDFPIHTLIEILLVIFTFEFTIMFVRLSIGLIAMLRGAGKPEI